MNMKELKQLIFQGEKIDVECKKAESSIPKSLYESYSAFGNTKSGYIILGNESEVTPEIRWNDRVTYDGTWENNLFNFFIT